MAGATFMAAGSSLPTMFISVTSVVLDEGDIGLGTIIGSTMFNILFITGICGVVTTVAVNLKPYSVIRDSFCYVIYLLVLLLAMFDGMIYWYEALVLTLMYGFYVVIMYFNIALEHSFNRWARARFAQTQPLTPSRSPAKSYPKSPQKTIVGSPVKRTSSSPIKGLKASGQGDSDVPENQSALNLLVGTALFDKHSQPKKPNKPMIFKNAETPVSANNQSTPSSKVEETFTVTEEYEDQISEVHSVFSDTDEALPHTKYDEEPNDVLSFPPGVGKWGKLRLTIMFPIRVLYFITIPDCRKASWESWYILTFIMSITWMGMHSYVLVWAVSVIGVTINIPECIMGLTLLAAGSSIPDAIASLVMAEQGIGEMALANAIGSNIFDMLCLSIPWLLSTTTVHKNSQVLIQGET